MVMVGSILKKTRCGPPPHLLLSIGTVRYLSMICRNVLLDLGLRAKVGDFGLTMDMEEEREEGGKPVIAIYWSAPEAVGIKDYARIAFE